MKTIIRDKDGELPTEINDDSYFYPRANNVDINEELG